MDPPILRSSLHPLLRFSSKKTFLSMLYPSCNTFYNYTSKLCMHLRGGGKTRMQHSEPKDRGMYQPEGVGEKWRGKCRDQGMNNPENNGRVHKSMRRYCLFRQWDIPIQLLSAVAVVGGKSLSKGSCSPMKEENLEVTPPRRNLGFFDSLKRILSSN